MGTILCCANKKALPSHTTQTLTKLKRKRTKNDRKTSVFVRIFVTLYDFTIFGRVGRRTLGNCGRCTESLLCIWVFSDGNVCLPYNLEIINENENENGNGNSKGLFPKQFLFALIFVPLLIMAVFGIGYQCYNRRRRHVRKRESHCEITQRNIEIHSENFAVSNWIYIFWKRFFDFRSEEQT